MLEPSGISRIAVFDSESESGRYLLCTWCLEEEQRHNEATFIVEVHTPDGEITQRLLACNKCARFVFKSMRDEVAQYPTGNYSVIRRCLPSDVVLSFHALTPIEDEE